MNPQEKYMDYMDTFGAAWDEAIDKYINDRKAPHDSR